MMKGLKRLTSGGFLLLEIRKLRKDLGGLRAAGERIAAALEAFNAQQWPQPAAPSTDSPSVSVTFVDTLSQLEFMDIEMRLTQARGMPPTDEEILQEYDRRHEGQAGGAG